MKKAKKIFFLLIFPFFLLRTFFAQTFPFRHYSDTEGMPDVYIKCIHQDSKGYLWFGTLNGISRFDGKEFRNFHVEIERLGDFIMDIMEDRNGSTWIATFRGGVSCFCQENFTNYTLKDGLVDMKVTTIVEDKDGSLWFGTRKGVSKFNTERKQFTTYTIKDGLVSNIIYKMIMTRDGSLWFGTLNGLSNFVDGRFVNYTLEKGLINNNIQTLMEDSKGRIWIGTEKGLSCLDKGKFFSYTTSDGLAGNMVLSTAEDQYGNIWFGTDNGLSRFSNGTFFNITTKNGLLSNAILSLLKDHEGNLWIGTPTGASCLYSFAITNYSVRDGLPNNTVWAIQEDQKGRYWFGTEDGLSCYNNGEFKNYTTADGLVNNRIGGLMEDHLGNIWIAADGGISVYSSESSKFTNYTQKNGLLSNVVNSVFEDRKGVIWIGTLDGLNRFDNGEFLVPRFKGFPLTAYIQKIIEDRAGNIWLRTPNGLYRISSSREQFTRFTTKNGLPHAIILSLLEDSKGNIWIGTKGGLVCYKDGTFINTNISDRLPDSKCYFILEDHRQNLWIGTSKGIARYNDETCKLYTQDDGLPAKNLSPACFRDSHGNLWFGSVKGVSRVNPVLDRANTLPPPVYITNINVVEKDMPLSDVYQLEYNQNYIKFGFVGLCFSAPESVVYKYRLEGIDKDWQETRGRLVSYPYLPWGSYRFQVKAVNKDNIESLAPAEIRFEILPPFWKTWWFTTILVLALLSLVVFFVIWRIRRVKERMAHEARTRRLVIAQRMELLGVLATGAVHDLKNLLAVILGYSKLAEKNYTRGQEGQNQIPMPIEKIKKTAGTAIQVVQQILAFTRQKHETTAAANLVEVLKDILDILNITRPPEVKILWEPPWQEIRYHINTTHFQQVVMNLCLNAVQAMPEGGELKISLSKTAGDNILLEVSDTGIGIEKDVIEKIFDPLYTTKEKEKGTGLGLFVVKQIVEEYDGQITVQSEPGQGTQFFITFPPRDHLHFEAGEILPLQSY